MSDKKFEYEDFVYDPYTYKDYVESGAVASAKSALDSHLTAKPGEYNSTWQDKLGTLYNDIANRKDFSYDFNGDALYQQYKDKYTQQAKMAMQDTMGQAAAMTGGYGNSYAATVGNQAYQATMQNLNDVIPELYQLALDRYNQEGQDLYNQYGLVSDMESRDYRDHRDTVSDWYTNRDYLTGRYDSERTYDYGKYVADRDFDYGKYSDDRTLDYSKYSDDKTIAYNEFRNAILDKQWQDEFDLALQKYEDSKVSYSGGGGGNVNYNNGGNDNKEFHKATFSRTDEYGNNVFYIDGKEQTFAPGINPYTGSKNSDIKNGTFSNGYQPNNVNGQKLSKSGITDVVNGVTQNVWKTPDGTKWIWDGTQNKYLIYED